MHVKDGSTQTHSGIYCYPLISRQIYGTFIYCDTLAHRYGNLVLFYRNKKGKISHLYYNRDWLHEVSSEFGRKKMF